VRKILIEVLRYINYLNQEDAMNSLSEEGQEAANSICQHALEDWKQKYKQQLPHKKIGYSQ